MEPRVKKEILKKCLRCVTAVLILMVLAGLIMARHQMDKKPTKFYCSSVIIPADDGTAYIPPMINDGVAVQIKATKIINAVPAPDWRNIVVLEKSGHLFLTDKEASLQTSIAQNADSIICVQNEGFVYKDKKKVYHRYLFSDGSDFSLGKLSDHSYHISDSRLQIAFTDGTSKIYTLLSSSNQREYIRSYSGDVIIDAISDDGNCVVYSNVLKPDSKEYIFRDGYGSKYTFPIAHPFSSCGYVNEYNNCLVLTSDLPVGQAAQKIFWGFAPFPYQTVSFIEGSTPLDHDINGVFWKTSYDLYLSGTDEEAKERLLLSHVLSFSMAGSMLYYTENSSSFEKTGNWYSDSGDLYSAVIEDTAPGKAEKIDSNVYSFKYSPSNACLYYFKGSDSNGIGSLYVYRPGEAPEKIAHRASRYDPLLFSTDGKTVYYFTEVPDPRVLNDASYASYGVRTLMQYTQGAGGSTKVADYVYPDSVTSVLESGLIDSRSFIYKCYLSTDRVYGDHFSWVYYNGTENTPFIEDTVDITKYYFKIK